jgi:hypothetical protein
MTGVKARHSCLRPLAAEQERPHWGKSDRDADGLTVMDAAERVIEVETVTLRQLTCRRYSTVTDFARFRGLSTSVPRMTAT